MEQQISGGIGTKRDQAGTSPTDGFASSLPFSDKLRGSGVRSDLCLCNLGIRKMGERQRSRGVYCAWNAGVPLRDDQKELRRLTDARRHIPCRVL